MPPSGCTKVSRYFRLLATSGSCGARPWRRMPVVTRAVMPGPDCAEYEPSSACDEPKNVIALATMASYVLEVSAAQADDAVSTSATAIDHRETERNIETPLENRKNPITERRSGLVLRRRRKVAFIIAELPPASE